MSVNDQLQQAYQLIRAGSRQEAVQLLMPILRADQTNADAWWLLANAVTDPNQKKRALEEVLKLRPGDERARKMLNQIAPPPPANTFDLDDDVFSPPPAAPAEVMPNWASASDTQTSVSPVGPDPFSSGGSDPVAPPPKAKNSAPPVYSQPPAGNVPPAPVYAGPPPRKGPSCCLIFSCLFILLICVAPTLCVGAGFAGLSPVFNQVAATLGARDFQSLVNVFSGQATPIPGSVLDDALDQFGVENFGQLQGTLEGFSTLVGTPGMAETLDAIALPSAGDTFQGTPVNKGGVEAGQTVNGNVTPNSAGDAWVISLNSGDSIVAEAEGVGGTDTTLVIVDSTNKVIDSNDDGSSGTDARLEFTASSNGKYTIIVGTFGNVGGEYQLTVDSQ